MEISIYTQWLNNGGTYAEAVELYNKYGSNNTLKSLFQTGETYYTSRKIAFEIKALENVVLPQVPQVYTEPKIKIDFQALPENLKKEYVKLGPLIGQIRFLHANLSNAQSKETRQQYALQILDCVKNRRAIFNEIDYWLKHKKQLVQPKQETVAEIPGTETEELKKLRLNEQLRRLRVQRSKLKKQPHRAEKLVEVCTLISKIEEELK